MRLNAHLFVSLISFLLFSLIYPSSANAATYYVSTTGSDNNTATQAQNIATPWKTIQKAADTVQAGDTVNVKSGTYSGSVSPKNSGTASSPITFQRDGAAPVIVTGSAYTGLNIYNVNWVIFDGFTFSVQGDYGVVISSGSHNVVKNSDVSGSCIGIHVLSGNSGSAVASVSDGNIITGNKIHDLNLTCDRGEGVYVKQYNPGVTSNTTVSNNEIWKTSEGVQNTAATVSSSGVLTDGGTPPKNTHILDNIFHDLNCLDQGILTVGGDNLIIDGNIAYNSSGNGKCSFGIGHAQNLVFKNNALYNNISGPSASRGCAYLFGGVSGIIDHNTFTNYPNMCFAVDGDVNLTMTNNIFSQIGGTQIMRSGSGNNLTLSNNLFGKSESNLGTGAVIGNPQFLSTDPNNANFLRLATGSPACLSGGAYMGAFPCNGSTTPPTTPSPSPIATPNYNIADLEPDGDVDGNDYLTLVSKFGLTGILGWIRSDILKNGVVDIFDFNRLISNFGI